MIISVAMLLLGPYLLWTGFKHQSDISQLEIDAVQGEGTVIEGREFKVRRGKSFELTVSYSAAEGNSFEKKFVVSQTVFNQHCGADSIKNPAILVEYSRSDPSVARLPGQVDNSGLLMIVGLALGSAGLAGCVYFGRGLVAGMSGKAGTRP